MKNTILKIEQLSQKYYPIIRNFSLIKEFSRTRLPHPFHSTIEEEKKGKKEKTGKKEKIKDFVIKNAGDFY